MKKQFYSVMLSAAVIACATGCHPAGSSSGNLATVNGDDITMDQFYRYLEHKPTVQLSTQGIQQSGQGQVTGTVVGSLAFQALEDLVRQQLMLQIAKDENVYPSKAAVEAELAHQTKENADIVRVLESKGLTLEDIRQELLVNLAEENILTKGITVTLTEANQYIKAHPELFTVPPSAKLLCILVKDQKTKALADHDLANGRPFSMVAASYSADPNARKTGGAYLSTNAIPVNRLPRALQPIITATPEFKTTNWLPQNGGMWVKFYVAQLTPSKYNPPTPDQTEDVRRNLAKQRGAQSTDLGKQIVARIKTAKIDVNVPYLSTEWKQAIQQFTAEQEQQNPTSTQTTSTSGSTGAPKPQTPAKK